MNLLSIILALLVPARPFISPEFKKFTSADGFPMVAISGLAQDNDGNIWFSNEDGGALYRFDGFDVKSFGGTNPKKIFISGTGEIFYVDDNRVVMRSGDRFKEIPIQYHGKGYLHFADLDADKVLITSKEEKVIYDKGSGTVSTASFLHGVGEISSMQKHDGNIYLGTTEGKIYEYTGDSAVFKGTIGSRIFSIAVCDSGDIYFGAGKKGLWEIASDGSRSLVLDGNVSCICAAGPYIWAGGDSGLFLYETGSGKCKEFDVNPADPYSIPHYSIRHIIKDKEGGIWIGTQYGGICYCNPGRASITRIYHGNGPNYLNDAVPSSIIETEDGKLLIGTNNGGVNCYDPSSGRIQYFKHSPAAGDNDVKALYQINGGEDILVGHYKTGLFRLNLKTGKFFRLNSPDDIYRIVDGRHPGEVILGNNKEVVLYDIGGDSLSERKKIQAKYLLRDSRKRLWLGGTDGLLVGDSLDLHLKNIKDILELRDNSFLIGTESGVYRFTDGTVAAEKLHIPSFPENCLVTGMEQDNDGRIWIGSTYGIYMVTDDFRECLHFTTADGLASNYCTDYTHCRLRNGNICFGGIGGITIFDPDRLSSTSECPPPVISSIKIPDKELTPESGGSTVLKHSQNKISFTFSTPDFISEGNDLFRCRLYGFDENLVYLGHDRTINYSNLHKGTYSMYVECSRNGNRWTPVEEPFVFRIKPVWFLSTVAVVGEVMILLLIIASSIVSALRKKEKMDEKKMEELETKHKKEISKLKALKYINSSPKGYSGTGKVITDISSTDEIFLMKAISIIENNLPDHEFGIEELARQMGISQMKLYREMIRISGAPASAMIQKIRFSKACSLLRETDKTAAEIAYLTGFSSPVYFAGCFKKNFGCTPKEYARREKFEGN